MRMRFYRRWVILRFIIRMTIKDQEIIINMKMKIRIDNKQRENKQK